MTGEFAGQLQPLISSPREELIQQHRTSGAALAQRPIDPVDSIAIKAAEFGCFWSE